MPREKTAGERLEPTWKIAEAEKVHMQCSLCYQDPSPSGVYQTVTKRTVQGKICMEGQNDGLCA